MAYRSAANAKLNLESFDFWGPTGSSIDVSLFRRQAEFAPESALGGVFRSGQVIGFGSDLGLSSPAFPAFYKGYDAFFVDGVGDKLVTPGIDNVTDPLLLDDVGGDDTGTAQAIAVDDLIYAVIEDLNDQDFFSITLEAGQTYAISQLLHFGGTAKGDGTLLSGVPLADAYIELYDADGTLLAEADGGSNTTPSGLDAKLFFTPTETGTYFINARSFDQDATNGTDGDHVGDYTLQVKEVAASEAPLPRFYSDAGQAPNPLLDSLDWGTTWDHTVRNPDGDNGTRTDNGVENGGTPITNTEYGIVGKNVMKFYFAKQGDVFLSEDPANPGLENNLQARNMEQWEKDAFLATMAIYEQATDLKYIEVDNRADADIKIIIYQGTPGAGASLLGRMSPPGEQNEGQTEINAGDYRWTEEGVSPGGFFFPTLLHEWGHGHGMKHPHDQGGGGPIMRGAGPSDDPVEGAIGGAFGDFDLSQQVYTIMSYNDGWNETGGPGGRPAGHGGPSSGGLEMQADHFGWQGTLAALDIALLQDKYGVNEEWAAGDDVYVIADENGPGNYYRTIWDGGGNDEIRYAGARDTVIDLRAATLKYEEGGGGRMSFALGAWTGFTIANGAVIENASTGDGDDWLVGNDAANRLSAGLGDDALDGGAGADVLTGGRGDDRYVIDSLADRVVEFRGQGTDQVLSSVNYNALAMGGFVETITLTGTARTAVGDAFSNTLIGNELANTLNGYKGADRMEGGLGNDTYIVDNRGDRAIERADSGIDRVISVIDHTLTANVENLTMGGRADIAGTGNDLGNRIVGNSGDNVIAGRGGIDFLTGGDGNDRFVYTDVSHSTYGAYDRITDLEAGDVIDLRHLDANSALEGDQAFALVGAFSRTAGEMILDDSRAGLTFLVCDTDGDGKGDFRIALIGDHGDFDNILG